VVCAARPELLSRRPGWGGGKPNATTVSLSPLSDDETAHLVHALLDRAVLPADVQTMLIERAGGNPLYAEEFARMVDEIGEEHELRLPESVQGIIAARLDALPLEEKQLLQDAAVVGKVFWLGTLELISDRDRLSAEQLLHALERKEFVRRERRSSVGDENQYAFRHILVRDVAYSQIPRAARADRHRGAAEWIESLGRPDDHAEMLAHHYLSAIEFAAAAGEQLPDVAERARLALRAAGDRALALSSMRPAAQFYESALELWPTDDPERPYVLLGYGKALREVAVEGAEALIEASAALAGRDREAAAEAEIVLADLYWRRGKQANSAHHRLRAGELIADAEPSPSKTYVFGQLARFHMLAGELDSAIGFGEEALAMADRLGLEAARAEILNTLGAALAGRGDENGLRLVKQSVEASRRLHTTELIRGLNNIAHQLIHRGELSAAEPVVEEMNSVARRFGYRDWIRWAQSKNLSLSYFLGRWNDAETLADELIGEVESGTPHYLAGEWRLYRSRIRLARGDRAGAEDDGRLGLEAAREAGDPQIVGPLVIWNARLLGSTAGASGLLDEFIELWHAGSGSILGAATGIPDAAASAVALGRKRQFIAAAEEIGGGPWLRAGVAYASGEFSEAADIFAEIGALPEEATARLLAARLLVESGLRAEAEPELHQALAFWRSVGATAYVTEGEALLAASA